MNRFWWPMAVGAIALAVGCAPRPAEVVTVSPSPTATPSVTPVPSNSPSPSGSPNSRSDLYPALYTAFHGPSLPFRVLPFYSVKTGVQVYRSAAEVEAMFNSPDIRFGTPPTLPPVDFSKEMIVSVMFQDSSLDQAEIVGVEEQQYGLLVRVVVWGPDPSGSPQPSTESFFSESVVVPRTDKPVVLGQTLNGTIGMRPSIFQTPPDPASPPIPLPGPLYPSACPSP